MVKEKNINQIYLFCILPVFIVILLFNFLTPYIADDWYYASAKSFLDIFRQEYMHYFTTNGRSVAHVIARFFLMYDKIIFDFDNSIIYVLFTGLIFVHAVYGMELSEKAKVICWIMIHLLLFIYVVNWGQVFLWLDGSCNYLWTGTIILFYLLPFRIYYSTPERFEINRISLILFPLICITGFLAGWCNENTSGGAILFSIILSIVFAVKKLKLQKWIFGGVVCSVISFSIMILSPGNARRRTFFTDSRAWYNQLITHFRSITNNIYNNYKYLLFTIAIITAIAMILHILRRYLVLSGIYFLTAIAIFYALILSPANNGRAFFGGSVFLVIACTGIFAGLIAQRPSIFGEVIGYFSVLCIVFAVNFVNACIDIAYFKVHSDRRDAFVIAQKEDGYKNIVVNEIYPKPSTKYNPAYGLSDLVNDSNEWPSTSYARYYNVDTVTAVPYDTFEEVFRNGAFDLINCIDIHKYLKLIKNPKYTVFMAVNDESSKAIDKEIIADMEALGLKTDLSQGYRWSYIAVIHKGDVLYEVYENKLLNYFEIIDNNQIEIVSSGKIYNKGNIASIKVNGKEYARNTIGLNIVIYDNIKGKVVDRVTFNTWDGLVAKR